MKTFSNFNSNIRTLQLANHLLMLVGFVMLITSNISIHYLYIGIVFYVLVVMVGSGVGLHRYFSHRTFKTTRAWEYVLGFLGTIATVGTILGWVGLHRYHHAHTDKDEDPHNPNEIGVFNAWFYNWKTSKFTKNFIRQELRDPMILFLHRHYFKVIFAYILLLGLIDPWLIVWCYCFPACGSYMGISAVTVLGHIQGYTNHTISDTSKNSWSASLLSLGEGWHNNHHANPMKYRQGEKWWELDPSAFIIEKIIMKK